MFFEDYSVIRKLAEKTGFSLFITPFDFDFSAQKPIKNSSRIKLDFPKLTTAIVEPKQDKICIDQIREINGLITLHSEKEQYIIVKNAELMNLAAQNAFLKLLEEPKDHYHFVFLATKFGGLLDTILSRATIFIFKEQNPLDQPIDVDNKTKDLANGE